MYRQLSLDYFDTEENLILRQVLELQGVSFFSKRICVRLFAMDMETWSLESVSHTESENVRTMSVCSDLSFDYEKENKFWQSGALRGFKVP